MRAQKIYYTPNKQNDETGYYKECSRFLPLERAEDITIQDVMVYDKLRSAGMQRKQALHFLKGQHCKIDSTQMKHGPPGYKLFTTKIERHKQLKGWQMTGKLNYKESALYEYSDDNQWGIQDQNKEEQQKMQQLKQFYLELNEKYSFDEMGPQEIVQKLRSLSTEEQYKKRVPQYQIRDKSKKLIYYEMAEHILSLRRPPQTLIQRLDVFDNTIPLVQKEYFEIEPKKIKKAIPLYSPQSVEKRSKLLKELARTYTSNVTVREETEEMKKCYASDLQTPSESVLSSLNDNEERSTRNIKKRCSIMTHRVSKFAPEDVEVVNFNIFRNKLEEVVSKGIKRMNCYANDPLF